MARDGHPAIHCDGEEFAFEQVVLCPPMTGAATASELSGILGAPLDRFGFFERCWRKL